MPILDRDSAHFAQATKQMLETGNYFQIRFQHVTRFQKPPGINWLQAASVKAFSHPQANASWAYRIPSLLGGLLTVLLVFALCDYLFDSKTALLAASLLAASLLMVVETHMAVTDAALLFTMVLMQSALWLIYHRHYQQKKIPFALPLLFWLAMGLGILIKGTSPLIGLMTILGICILQKDWRFIKAVRPFSGIIILLLSSSWLIGVSIAEHSNYLYQMFHKDLAPKLVSGVESHGMPPGYYLGILAAIFWPASIVLWHAILWGWNHRKQLAERFLIAWLIPNWLFYALMPTKLPQYMLPLFPALAILSALAIANNAPKTYSAKMKKFCQYLYCAWGVLCFGLGLAFVFADYYLNQSLSLASIIAALAIWIATVIALRFAFKEQLTKATITMIIAAVISYGMVFQYMLPNSQALWISQRIENKINTLQDKPSNQQPLLAMGFSEPSLVFTLGTYHVLYSTPKQAITQLNRNPKQLVLLNKQTEKIIMPILNKAGFQLNQVANIKGFNYSKGHWVDISLWQRQQHGA